MKSNFQVLLSGMLLGRYVDAHPPPPQISIGGARAKESGGRIKRTSGRRILSKSGGHLHWMELVQSVGHCNPSLLDARIKVVKIKSQDRAFAQLSFNGFL